jgi:hypothetical protein
MRIGRSGVSETRCCQMRMGSTVRNNDRSSDTVRNALPGECHAFALRGNHLKLLIFMVRPAGLEPATERL